MCSSSSTHYAPGRLDARLRHWHFNEACRAQLLLQLRHLGGMLDTRALSKSNLNAMHHVIDVQQTDM
jgi:hypothetical protein